MRVLKLAVVLVAVAALGGCAATTSAGGSSGQQKAEPNSAVFDRAGSSPAGNMGPGGVH